MLFVGYSSKISPLRKVHQYIFSKQCNALHIKNPRHRISDIDYRHDVSLCMRGWKKMINKKKMREKILK